MNMTRPSMNNSVILASRHNIIMISENMIKGRIISQRTYLGFAGGGTLTITTCSGADGVTMMLLMERSRQCLRRRYEHDLDRGRVVVLGAS